MKKIIIILIVIFIITGCNSKHKKLICKSTIKEDIVENITIQIEYSNNKVYDAKKEVKVQLTDLSDSKKEEIKKYLKQNYCNNTIKTNYSCTISEDKTHIILKEKGKTKDLLGIIEEYTIKDYKKILKEKDFKCK